MTRPSLMKTLIVFGLVAAFAVFAWRSLPSADGTQEPGGRSAAASGVVRGIDTRRGSVTISHGPVPELNMTAMTMEFAVKRPEQLSSLRPGQRVDFRLAHDGRDFLITDIR